MSLQIVGIFDRGVANQERLYLRVLANTNLHFFVVLDTVYIPTQPVLPFLPPPPLAPPWGQPQQISRLPRHTYWFATREVKAGDHIILYTGPGAETQSRNADGTTNHFLRWGLRETIWNSPESCAVLMEISMWQTTAYGGPAPPALPPGGK